jgi:hypothetical protein
MDTSDQSKIKKIRRILTPPEVREHPYWISS